MTTPCGNFRKWIGGRDQSDGRRGCVCDLPRGHDGKHEHAECGLRWGPGNENYENKARAAKFHATERIQGRQTTLQVLRTRAGLSQAEFAATFGYSQSEVSRWEKGELIPDNVLPKVVRALKRLSHHELPDLDAHDLNRSWDETLLTWQRKRPV